MTWISVFDSIQNVNVKEAEVEGSGGGGGCKNSTATSHHIVPRHVLCACDRTLALSSLPPPPRHPFPRSPPQARQHLQVRRARLSGGSETDVTPAPLRLNSHKNTHAVLYTHAGGDSEPAPGPSRSDGAAWPWAWPQPAAPQTGKGRNWLQLWPSTPSLLPGAPPSH